MSTKRYKPKTSRPCAICSREFPAQPSQVAKGKRFCSPECRYRWLRKFSGDAFWERVDKNGPEARPGLGPCWLWLGCTGRHGYGIVVVHRKRKLTHRISYELSRGNPGDQLVLHKCDVRPCVRPEHLFLGSHADNSRDARAKGRVRPPPNGVLHNEAKLNPEKVREIRRLFAEGVPVRLLTTQFSVKQDAIYMVLKRQTWKNVL